MRFYNFPNYCVMLTDEKRRQAYENFLRKNVTQDSVVLDLGAGTGYFSILACKLGARKVYAVEPNHLIHLAKEFAQQNGCADRIEFFQKLSTDVEFDEKADILISDLHGSLPFFDASVATIVDARVRLVKEDGVIAPRRERVFFAVAECADFYAHNISRFLQNFSGVEMSSAKRLLTNRLLNLESQTAPLLTAPQLFAEVDYRSVSETNFAASLVYEATKSGTANGLRGWFECELDEENTTTNAPENGESVYGTPFFPFDEPVEIETGDVIEVALNNSLENGEYIWNWQTKISDRNRRVKAEFSQSTMLGNYIPASQMLKKSEFYVTTPSLEAQIDGFILSRLDGEKMQGDVADELLENFAGQFTDFEHALERVWRTTNRYGD